jgi:Undecaprenyl-phosphate galactose phosphotransferase WbaP
VLGIFVIVYACAKLYPSVPLAPALELRRLTVLTTLVFLGLGTATFLSREGETYSRGVLLGAWLLALVLVPVGRAALRVVCAPRRWWGYPVVVVGAGPTGQTVVHTLQNSPDIGLKPVAVLDEEQARGPEVYGVPVLHDLELDDQLAVRGGARYAVMALADLDPVRAQRLVARYSQSFHHLLVIPPLSGLGSLWVNPAEIGGMVGIEVRHRLLDPGRRLLKRVLDVALILASTPVLLPLMGLLMLAVRIDSPGRILYRSPRVGRHGERLDMLKFRTMYEGAEEILAAHLATHPEARQEWETMRKLKDDPRMTPLGKWLRRTSLDELPQLWHVLRGEMSLVGPRPIYEDDAARYGNRYALYKQVDPGITGIWQVSGRNELTYDERVAMDCYYVRNWSVWLDVYLLARTVLAVLLCRGAY